MLADFSCFFGNIQVVYYNVRNLKVVMKSASTKGSRLCFLEHLKLLEKSLPLSSSLLLLLFFSSLLSLLFFQCRLVQSLCELD